MARVLHGDSHFAAALTYGSIQNAMHDYVNAELAKAQQMVVGMGQQMFQRAESVRDSFVNSNAFRLAEAAIRQVQSMWGMNAIQPLPELWQVQNAPLVMQPYIMANPMLRNLYMQQRCDGYSGTYFDVQPDAVGESHDDWRKAMSGLLQTKGNDDDQYDVFVTYCTDDAETAKPLSFEAQMDIQNAWVLVEDAIYRGVDPSSRWNDDLG
jgi:hypothetical protein